MTCVAGAACEERTTGELPSPCMVDAELNLRMPLGCTQAQCGRLAVLSLRLFRLGAACKAGFLLAYLPTRTSPRPLAFLLIQRRTNFWMTLCRMSLALVDVRKRSCRVDMNGSESLPQVGFAFAQARKVLPDNRFLCYGSACHERRRSGAALSGVFGPCPSPIAAATLPAGPG